jgi:hypothetical protein
MNDPTQRQDDDHPTIEVPAAVEPNEDASAGPEPGNRIGDDSAADGRDGEGKSRSRGPHGRRRRGRGERPAPVNGEPVAQAGPPLPLAGEGEDINPEAMAISLSRDILKRGRRGKTAQLAQSEAAQVPAATSVRGGTWKR